MALKVILVVCLVGVVRASVLAPSAAAPVAARLEEFDPRPQYSYGYDVQDSLTGDYKSAQEVRDGDLVQGSYSLVDPDGTRRTVDYAADSINGFNAVVRKEPLIAAAPVVETIAQAPVITAARLAAPVAPARLAAPVAPARLAAPVAPARFAAPAAPIAARLAAPITYSAPLRYAAYTSPIAKVAAPISYTAPVAKFAAYTSPLAYSAPVAYTSAAYTAAGPLAYAAPVARFAEPLTYAASPYAKYTAGPIAYTTYV